MYTTLVNCPLFRGLTAEQIEKILPRNENISRTKYKAGEKIAQRDTAYSGLMILLQGSASGVMVSPDGRSQTIEAIEAPQPIAPAFLFGGYNRLPVDVIAQSDAEVLTLHRGLLFELMQADVVILSNFIDIISNRANAWSKKIYALSFSSLRQKVASYLLDHSSPEQSTVAIPGIAETAQFFAATRSALTSVLEGLAKKGIIKFDPVQVTILRREALGEILK